MWYGQVVLAIVLIAYMVVMVTSWDSNVMQRYATDINNFYEIQCGSFWLAGLLLGAVMVSVFILWPVTYLVYFLELMWRKFS